MSVLLGLTVPSYDQNSFTVYFCSQDRLRLSCFKSAVPLRQV